MNDPFKPSLKEGASFTLANRGMHSATVVAVVDEGKHLNEKYNKVSNIVSIGFEITQKNEETGEDENLVIFSRRYTNSLHKNSALRKDLESWLGAPMSKDQVDQFNLRQILGKSCTINVVHTQSQDGTKTYANIANILPKSVDRQPSEEPYVYTVHDPDTNFDRLPKYVQNRVMASQQLKGVDGLVSQPEQPQTAPQAAPAPANNVQTLDF